MVLKFLIFRIGITFPEIKLLAGKTLKIYSDANVNDIPTVTSKTTKNLKSKTENYTVKSGDSLYSIAEKNKTTVAKLKSINGLTSNKIKTGQELRINLNYIFTNEPLGVLSRCLWDI